MIIDLIHNIVIFLFAFSVLSIMHLIISFLKALLSTPPKKFELERRVLIYYGICVSFIITTLLNF